MKIGTCRNCGILVNFDSRYEKSSWINHQNEKRMPRCPSCDYAMTEGEDTVTVSTEEE
jgi:hypothetical protein